VIGGDKVRVDFLFEIGMAGGKIWSAACEPTKKGEGLRVKKKKMDRVKRRRNAKGEKPRTRFRKKMGDPGSFWGKAYSEP